MKSELAGKCYPSKQIIICCAVRCSIGIFEIYAACEWPENPLRDFTVCTAACSRPSLPSSLQMILCDRHIDRQTNTKMQECKHTAMPSHGLWRNKMQMQGFEANINPQTVPAKVCNMWPIVIVFCCRTLWLYLLIAIAPGNLSLSSHNHIKLCKVMTPHAIRNSSRIWSRLLELNLR